MKPFFILLVSACFSVLSLQAASGDLSGQWKAETMNITSAKRKVTEADHQRAVFRDLFVYRGQLDILPDGKMQYGGGAGTPASYTIDGNRLTVSGQGQTLTFRFQLRENQLILTLLLPDGIQETYTFTR